MINIKALDNIIKLDKDDGYYNAKELIDQKGYAILGELAEDICNKKGLELETSSFLNSDNKITVYDNQLSAREYMSYIAEKTGGFCCANREGKITFRKIGQDTTEIPLRLFKTYKFGEEYKISKVAYEDGTRSFKFGDDTRNTLWIRQENLFVTAEKEIQDIYNEIKDLTINSFEGSVLIDPAIDIGDKIIIDGKPIIYQGEMTLNKRFIADIKSKISIKQKEETTVKKESQKVVNRRVQSEINQIDGKITQLIEENTETTEKLSKHEQTIDSITNIVSENTTEINNNYQEIIDKLGDKAQKDDVVSLENKVETIQTNTEYAIKVSEDIQTNGVSKVKTETGYTFDDKGLTIEKTGAKTKATYNEIGVDLKDTTGSSEESLLFAGYDEEIGETVVKSKNMNVEKYLTVGKYSRIEDYEEGAGVFWIGGNS